jgi:hypothetical protein
MSSPDFFKLIVFSNLNTKDISLNNLTETFEIENNISIEKQSLDEKFDAESVEFAKRMLQKFLQQIIFETTEKYGEILAQFESIKIKDATSFKLSDLMIEKYRSSIKNPKMAILKIQFEYDLKTGKIYDLSLHSYTESDDTNAQQTLEAIGINELIIRDLGYISLNVLEGISAKEAFFINRFDFSTNAYKTVTSIKKIDFSEIQSHLKKFGLTHIEKKVYIGDKKRFPVRMIIELLPEQELEKRLRKLKRTESHKCRTYSKEYKERLGLNVFITNISKEKLGIKKVRQIYRLRWQIELVFKTWKSVCKLEQTKKMRLERFETMLYAKLILILMIWLLYHNINQALLKSEKKYLSIYKTYKTFVNSLKEIKLAINQGLSNIYQIFNTLIRIIKKKDKLEKKKNTMSSLEILQLNKKSKIK